MGDVVIVEFPTRDALVAAVVEARKNGIAVDILGDGKTLRYPDGGDELSRVSEEIPEPAVEEAPAPILEVDTKDLIDSGVVDVEYVLSEAPEVDLIGDVEPRKTPKKK